MTDQDRCVWVKRHRPSDTWYVLCDWMYGGAGVDSSFDNIDDAIAVHISKSVAPPLIDNHQ